MLFYYFSALGTLIAYKESCKKNDIEKEEEIKLTYHERCTLTRHYWCVVRFRVSIAPSAPTKSQTPTTKQPKATNDTSSNPTPNSSTDSSTPMTSSSDKLPQTGDDQKQEMIVTLVGGLLIALMGIGQLIRRKI